MTVGKSRKSPCSLGERRATSLNSRQTGEAAPRVERSARTARGWSAGDGREEPQRGLDVDALAARDGKCLIKPRLARRDRLLAAPPRAPGASSRYRVCRESGHIRGAPRLSIAVVGFGRVVRRILDRSFPEPLCPGGPRLGAEGAPGGRGMRGPRHGLGGV